MIAQDLVELFSRMDYRIKYLEAKTNGTCIKCGNPAQEFRDVSGMFEYRISALCQTCRAIDLLAIAENSVSGSEFSPGVLFQNHL